MDLATGIYTVLSIIDMGTLYHSAWIVSDKGGTPSSQKCAEIFRDHWFTHFGPPKYLTVDRGVANRGQVAALMSAQGVYIRYAGTEAHHQIGRAERQGSLLKEIIKNTVAARHIVGVSGMRMAVMESTFVKNCRVNHAGFSPTQWVMGKLPDDVTSLTVEQAPNRLGVHEEMVTGETEFAQQLNIRQAAKEALSMPTAAAASGLHCCGDLRHFVDPMYQEIWYASFELDAGMDQHGSLDEKAAATFG